MRRTAGFTLIEMLMTVVILSLIAGALLAPMGAANRSSQLRASAAEWQDIDRRARIVAAREGPLVIEVENDVLSVRRLPDETPYLRVDLPEFLNAELTSSGPLVIDRHGRSADYEIVLRTDDYEQESRWLVHGVLGTVEEVAE